MSKAALLLAALALPFSCNALAAKPDSGVSGPDFSGTYDCKGLDSHEGAYTGVVTLKRVPEQSAKGHDAYSFTLEVPGFGKYPGFAVARGTDMAIYFALTDPAQKNFGTGLAKFKKNKAGKWTFHKHYYEPEFKGGNYGEEDCVKH